MSRRRQSNQTYVQRSLGWPRDVAIDFKSRDADVLVLHGEVSGCWVEVERRAIPKSRKFTWTVNIRHPSIPEDLTLRAATFASAVRVFFEGDLQIGDPEFDEKYQILGTPAVVAALLSGKTRFHLNKWLARGLTLENGRLNWIEKGTREGHRIALFIRELVELTRRLRIDERGPSRKLLKNALEDWVVGVRLNNIRCLLTTETSLRPSKLRALMESLQDVEHPDVDEILADGRLYQSEHHPETFNDLDEATLLGLLEYSEAHQLAALAALGKCGTNAALPAVVELSSGLFRNAKVKEAAKEAAGAILKRVGGHAGALSIVADKTGGLTVTE